MSHGGDSAVDTVKTMPLPKILFGPSFISAPCDLVIRQLAPLATAIPIAEARHGKVKPERDITLKIRGGSHVPEEQKRRD
jgi:hypothetical protein